MISVVIPSYKRPEILFGVLMNISNQDAWNEEGGEIIVSVDSNDPLLKKYENYIRQYNFIVKDKINCKLVINKSEGLVLAKNNAVKIAKGEYIMMMDDDLYMERDYISSISKDLDQNKNICAVSGYIVSSVPAISHTQPSDLINEVPRKKKLQTLNLEINNGKWQSVFGQKEQVMDWSEVRDSIPSQRRYKMDYFVNSYMFRKEAFLKVGGYNLKLNSKTSAHEEVDFTFRIQRNVGDLLFNPFVKMWHITVGEGGIYKGNDWNESKKILEKEYTESLVIFLSSIS